MISGAAKDFARPSTVAAQYEILRMAALGEPNKDPAGAYVRLVDRVTGLREEGTAHSVGTTKAARWYPGRGPGIAGENP